MTYVLYKNNQPVIYGLGRKTYLMALESIKKRAIASGLAVSMSGVGNNLWLNAGTDVYKLECRT